MPALFDYSVIGRSGPIEQEQSLVIAGVLFAICVLSLIFSLRTHRHHYVGEGGEDHGAQRTPLTKPLVVLAVATLFIAALSEFLVRAIRPAAERLGFTQVFVGVIMSARLAAR